jgi:hypothetical protein
MAAISRHVPLHRHTAASTRTGQDRTDVRQCGRAAREGPDIRRAGVIEQWTGSGNLLVVTRGANIQALTGIQPASGEIVVVRGGSGGGREAVGRLMLD